MSCHPDQADRRNAQREPDFARLAKLIGADVALAAAMLKTVNSPFYGLRTKASSVNQAITLLGLRNVTQLVTGLMLRDAFPGGSSDVLDELWEATAAIAQITSALAREFKGTNRDEAYTFALFRDCGMLAMMGCYQNYEPSPPGAPAPAEGSVTAHEDARYSMNHARLGSRLAASWLLPDEICQAVRWHHHYAGLQDGSANVPAASARYIALALVAEAIYVQQTMGVASPEWEQGAAFAAQALGGIDAAELAEIMERVGQQPGLY